MAHPPRSCPVGQGCSVAAVASEAAFLRLDLEPIEYSLHFERHLVIARRAVTLPV